MLRVELKFVLSLSLASLFAGCTGLGRAVSPGPQRPASAPRRSTPPPIPGVHGAVPHVARQQAVLEDAPCDGIKNRYCTLVPAVATVRDAVAALYADGCQATARELWDLVGEIVENQVSEHPRQASCEKRGTLPSMCEALLV